MKVEKSVLESGMIELVKYNYRKRVAKSALSLRLSFCRSFNAISLLCRVRRS
jgi:hypothetical protein